MKNKLQITQDEINNIENFNLPLLQEAMRQVELKINDEDVRKERIDTRSYSLLTVFLGIIGVIYGAINLGYVQENISMFIISSLTGVLIVISTMFLFEALKSKPYGSRGTYPHSWLSKEYIKNYDKKDTNNNYILSLAIARLLYSTENNVKISDKSNSQRVKILNLSLFTFQFALLPILAFFLLRVYTIISCN